MAQTTWGVLCTGLIGLCCLHLLTSSFTLLPALGPEVITVCLHTDSNEAGEIYSLSDYSTFWLLDPPAVFYNLDDTYIVCWWPRVAARIIPQHALAGLIIPAGMSHSPLPDPSIRLFIQRSPDRPLKIICRRVHDNVIWGMMRQTGKDETVMTISASSFIQKILVLSCQCRIF